MATEGGADPRTADNDPVLRMRMYIQFKLLDQLRIRPEPDLTDVHPKWMTETTDAILGAIAEAGLVIVDAERLDALVKIAEGAKRFRQDENNDERLAGLLKMDVYLAKLQPGDLDGPGGGEGIQPSEWAFGDGETIPMGPAGE